MPAGQYRGRAPASRTDNRVGTIRVPPGLFLRAVPPGQFRVRRLRRRGLRRRELGRGGKQTHANATAAESVVSGRGRSWQDFMGSSRRKPHVCEQHTLQIHRQFLWLVDRWAGCSGFQLHKSCRPLIGERDAQSSRGSTGVSAPPRPPPAPPLSRRMCLGRFGPWSDAWDRYREGGRVIASVSTEIGDMDGGRSAPWALSLAAATKLQGEEEQQQQQREQQEKEVEAGAGPANREARRTT